MSKPKTANDIPIHPLRIDGPVVVLTTEDYERLLEEAGYVTNPNLAADAQEALKELERGECTPWEDVKKSL